MSPKRTPRQKRTTTVQVTVEERDMLLAHAEPGAGLDEMFRGASEFGPLISLELEDDELGEFLRIFEATANGAQNMIAMERLGWAFARIEAGFAGETDPGLHMLRPALGRLDITPRQGQYLAFIDLYSRLHRRAPAEADIQAYFRTSAPSVHGILKTLQKRGLITRTAGEGRSTRVTLAPHEIPQLE